MKRILIQLDTDPHPSAFDRVVAIDAGVEELFSYGGISAENAEGLVHGAMFTRGPADLKHTAIFVGGSDVTAGEKLFKRVQKTFFGPIRVSVMMDSNGSNTTAAAAVLAAAKHVDLNGAEVLVLGGTGPVGHRAAQILAMKGAHVRVASRSIEKAQGVCDAVSRDVDGAKLRAVATGSEQETDAACAGVSVIIAAGAAGVELLSAAKRESLKGLKVAVDLNAVPPAGIGGIEATDKAKDRNGTICYGALGVGGMKMKIHKAAVAKLFEANDQILDTAAICTIGESIL
ncbi:MAG: NAD(P)-dependent methylenetetrahydromethanopterin dehydrogenase [Planctomycetaceae bacterium]